MKNEITLAEAKIVFNTTVAKISEYIKEVNNRNIFGFDDHEIVVYAPYDVKHDSYVTAKGIVEDEEFHIKVEFRCGRIDTYISIKQSTYSYGENIDKIIFALGKVLEDWDAVKDKIDDYISKETVNIVKNINDKSKEFQVLKDFIYSDCCQK